MRFKLVRATRSNVQTLGHLWIFDGTLLLYHAVTLELTWKNNERQTSCIPAGKYHMKKYNSEKNGWCFLLTDVPNRDGIEIHAFNTYLESKGCIAVGSKFTDINKDGFLDVIESRKTLQELLDIMPDESTIEIFE